MPHFSLSGGKFISGVESKLAAIRKDVYLERPQESKNNRIKWDLTLCL